MRAFIIKKIYYFANFYFYNFIIRIKKLSDKGHRSYLPNKILNSSEEEYGYLKKFLNAAIAKKSTEEDAKTPISETVLAKMTTEETELKGAELNAKTLIELYNKLFEGIFGSFGSTNGGSRKNRKTTKRKTTKRKTTKRKTTKRKTTKRKITKRKISKKKSSKRKPTKK